MQSPSSSNTELVFDPSEPEIDESIFQRQDWASSEYGHISGEEELPPNAPAPRGMGFTMRAKVDAIHASDTVTRRSRTGFMIFLNSSLVYFSSKKQLSVESSTFGSEFIAMKQCCEYMRGLRYKLRMMGDCSWMKNSCKTSSLKLHLTYQSWKNTWLTFWKENKQTL